MQPASGSVYVKNGTLLDRESRSLYTATLQASDTDGKAGTTLLEISLTDVNDEPPVINRETYFEFVAEGQPFEMVIQVKRGATYNTPLSLKTNDRSYELRSHNKHNRALTYLNEFKLRAQRHRR